MKKAVYIAAVLLLTCSLAACGGMDSGADSGDSTTDGVIGDGITGDDDNTAGGNGGILVPDDDGGIFDPDTDGADQDNGSNGSDLTPGAGGTAPDNGDAGDDTGTADSGAGQGMRARGFSRH